MIDFQIGLDIATSLTVIAAAIKVIKSQASQTAAKNQFAIKQRRIEHMSRLIDQLCALREEGQILGEKLLKKSLTEDDINDFILLIIRRAEIGKVAFKTWAKKDEMEILEGIRQFTVDASNSRTPNLLNDLNKHIEQEVDRLSGILKEEIESLTN